MIKYDMVNSPACIVITNENLNHQNNYENDEDI